jgi:hypothetical protein
MEAGEESLVSFSLGNIKGVISTLGVNTSLITGLFYNVLVFMTSLFPTISLILLYILFVLISTPALIFNVAAVVISEWVLSSILVACSLGEIASLAFDKL